MEKRIEHAVSFADYLTNMGARLCPFRLNSAFKIVDRPGAKLYNTIYGEYGCIKHHCTAWVNNKCKALCRE